MASAPQNRPRASCADFVSCLETHDFGEKSGKQALHLLFITYPRDMLDRYSSLKDKYREEGGFPVGLANRMAAVDVVRGMPGADDYGDAFWESLSKGRPDAVSAVASPVESVTQSSAKRKKASSEGGSFDKLRTAVRARDRKGETTGGLPEAVAWVASNIREPLSGINADEVPNCEALNQLMFARENEAEWRRSYDCKRVPAKGFASDTERGFVDDGEAVHEVYLRIKAEMVPRQPITETVQDDEHVRDLQPGQGGGVVVAVEEVDDGGVPAAVSGVAS